ncbi:MAG: hypothetical protein ABFD10_18945 [Prolixibacteraceae bacterium]
MKTFRSLLIVCFTVSFGSAFSQKASISIGESTTNSLTKNKPAQIIATFPENETIKNSWLADGFIEFKLTDLFKSYNIGALSELHKNNLTSKEQDVLQFGLTIEKDYLFNDSHDQTCFRIISGLNMKYANNRVKGKKELQGNLGLTLSLEKSENFRFLQPSTRLINITSSFAYLFTLSHDHNIGLGYIGGDENVLLGDASFELSIFPLSRLTNLIEQPELIQVNWNINGRTPLLGETDIDLNTLQTFSAGFNYKINDKSSVGISYSWQKGANPYTRLDNQEFKTLSAKLKLTIG